MTKNKIYILIIALVILSVIIFMVFKINYFIYPISRVNAKAEWRGRLSTHGYVSHVSLCPSHVPNGPLYDACLGDHIIISEDKEYDWKGWESVSNKEMVIFIDKDNSLEEGREYVFLIDFLEESSEGFFRFKLIKYKLIK